MLFWYVGLLAVTTLASVVAARQVVLVGLDERIDRDLVQETNELRTLAQGGDPVTQRPFGSDPRRLFDTYLSRNVPSRDEVLLTYVDGALFDSRGQLPYPIAADSALAAKWGRVTATERGRVDTPGGDLDFVAVPVQASGATLGVFVVGVFVERERKELDDSLRAAGAVGLAILVIGSLLSWRLARRILEPITMVTRTARAITETDLGRRIPVQSRDEVGELAQTFNEMLNRLEAGFTTQREFVDDAGHELKTPITIISGHLELLSDDPVERRETLALVRDELGRMSRIVNDLLVLARSDHPEFLDLDMVDVAVLTDEILEKASGLGAREWRIDEVGRGLIVADRQRLTQALVQLAQNAVTHTPDDGSPILIGSSVSDGDARFWVRDSGPGVPVHERERIFQRFARGGRSRRRDGSGLGLAIVRAVAEAHHGRVELTSPPGGGAVFTLVIPQDQPPGLEGERPSAAS